MELADYVVGLTGNPNRQIAFRAGYDQMIRVREDLFVADALVEFDVESIDDILEKSIIGDFASIRNIATFALFPSCGFTWNYYLLESFCYKVSKKYRLEIINFNDKNAGIIVKKDLHLSYFDMLVKVVAKSNVDLTAEDVGKYLFNNGYTAKSKMAALNDIVEKARAIREGR